jgi:acetylornithine/succinyldiaminopimelate/putrescine aminotransferase
MGLEFPEEGGGLAAAASLFEVGVFTVWAGNDPRVVQFLPPLVLSDDEAEDLITRVRTALG